MLPRQTVKISVQMYSSGALGLALLVRFSESSPLRRADLFQFRKWPVIGTVAFVRSGVERNTCE
jgi:hypothetical protein